MANFLMTHRSNPGKLIVLSEMMHMCTKFFACRFDPANSIEIKFWGGATEAIFSVHVWKPFQTAIFTKIDRFANFCDFFQYN